MLDRLIANFEIPLSAFIIVAIFSYIYVLKSKKNNTKNKNFNLLLIIGILFLLLETFNVYTMSISENYRDFSILVCKTYITLFIFEIISLIVYLVSYRLNNMYDEVKKHKIYKTVNISRYILMLLIFLFVIFLFNANIIDGYFYHYETNIVLNIIIYILYLLVFGLALINNKNISKEQKLPLYICFCLIVIFEVLSYFRLVYNVYGLEYALIITTLFFTIESQEKIMIEELSKAKELAEQSSILQSEFLVNMSHEIKSPMNTIVGYSDSLLCDKVLNEATIKQDMNNINIASNQLLFLVKNILDTSKVEFKKNELSKANYNLDELVNKINSEMRYFFSDPNVTFSSSIEDNAPRNLIGDEEKIFKLITSLLHVAKEHTKLGRVLLNIGFNQNNMIVTITNTGNGLNDNYFKISLDDFMKKSLDYSGMTTSTILGLVIFNELLKIMNGSIQCINNEMETKYIVTINQEINNQGGDVK